MTFDLILVVTGIGVFVLLLRIDHGLQRANRNLEQIASALRTKS